MDGDLPLRKMLKQCDMRKTGSMIVEKPVEYPVEWSADFINWFYDYSLFFPHSFPSDRHLQFGDFPAKHV